MQNISDLTCPRPQNALPLILKTNEDSVKYGLVLTPAQALEIARTHSQALRENRIVEVGCGAVTKLIAAFSASSFVCPDNYAEVISEMTEAFYHIKREVDVEINDDAVIAAMVDFFDWASYGSLALFLGRDLEILIRYIQKGRQNWEDQPDYHLREEDRYDSQPEFTSAHSNDF